MPKQQSSKPIYTPHPHSSRTIPWDGTGRDGGTGLEQITTLSGGSSGEEATSSKINLQGLLALETRQDRFRRLIPEASNGVWTSCFMCYGAGCKEGRSAVTARRANPSIGAEVVPRTTNNVS